MKNASCSNRAARSGAPRRGRATSEQVPHPTRRATPSPCRSRRPPTPRSNGSSRHRPTEPRDRAMPPDTARSALAGPVVLVNRVPGDRFVDALCPLRDGNRLPVTGRRDHQRDPTTTIEHSVESLPSRQPIIEQRRTDLRRDEVDHAGRWRSLRHDRDSSPPPRLGSPPIRSRGQWCSSRFRHDTTMNPTCLARSMRPSRRNLVAGIPVDNRVGPSRTDLVLLEDDRDESLSSAPKAQLDTHPYLLSRLTRVGHYPTTFTGSSPPAMWVAVYFGPAGRWLGACVTGTDPPASSGRR